VNAAARRFHATWRAESLGSQLLLALIQSCVVTSSRYMGVPMRGKKSGVFFGILSF
jgi:hypothetical protein